MKIYLDITNLMEVDFLTGIQRVVREIAVRFLRDERLEMNLLAYSETLNGFEFMNNRCFYDYFVYGRGKKEEIRSGKKCAVIDMEPGSIFYDIDSVWHSKQKRSKLLPELRNRGLKLAVFLHDIIPIIHPQYVHQNTIVLFMEYLGAYLKYADIIIASTESTLKNVNKLIGDLGIKPIPGFVSWLGVDFSCGDGDEGHLEEDARKAVVAGKYVLMVGTIEPRKNHRLVLDAFDHGLFDLGYHLVFAGHFGWDINELKKRITGHPLLGKKLFYIENGNDATIDYLYRNAYIVAFPSFAEGFGLPIVEALGRGIPVVASNYDVIYEVGKGYAEFFNPLEEKGFYDILDKYHNNPRLYDTWKQKIQSYIPFSWEQAEQKMAEALLTLSPPSEKAKMGSIKQMVMLTARTEDFLNTMPFIEAYMHFITEMVICCPDKAVESMREGYHGKIKLIFMPDSKVLEGHALPKDHQCRNFFLRCLLIQKDVIDEVFIMSDDDYRPLCPITQDVFLDGDKYRAFYFYEMHAWRGCQGALTSFDEGVHRTVKFCDENKLPTMQFNAHIPQIIEKGIYIEMIMRYKGIEVGGFDEWSMYFNYLMAHYPNKVSFCEYKTMNWPGSVTDWTMYCQPKEFLFENFYDYEYLPMGIFSGISSNYNENTLEDNKKKVKLVLQARERYNSHRRFFEQYSADYRKKYGESPVFCITNALGKAQLFLPKEIKLATQSTNRIDISIYGVAGWESNPQKIIFEYYYIDQKGRKIANGRVLEAWTKERWMEIPFVAPHKVGKYELCCEAKVGSELVQAKTDLEILDF